MLKLFILLSLVTFPVMNTVCAETKPQRVVIDTQEGALMLQQLITACKEIEMSQSNAFVDKAIVGKIITINHQKYKIRYFSFEDTTGKLDKNTTFGTYIQNADLSAMKSTLTKPLPGIHFESFDYRRAQLNDGVYFSMALRLVPETI